MKYVIQNGTLVNSKGKYQVDIEITDGKITAIGTEICCDGKTVIDATGKLILPGAIDLHTHMSDPFGGTVSSDNEMTGTRAAACGGVTTLFDFATQNHGMHLQDAIEQKKKAFEGNACIDYTLHCIVTDLFKDDSILNEFSDVVKSGINTFKCYFVYRKEGLMIEDEQFSKILVAAANSGGMTTLHAENAGVIDYLIGKFQKEGNMTPWYHYLSRPEFVSAEAVQRAVILAKNLKAPLYIVHIDCKEGIETIANAKKEGYPIFAETCPHYLEFNCDVYKEKDAVKYVCSPPIKNEESRLALWNGVKNGTIDTIATDHCPFLMKEKNWGENDFTKIPNGCGGIENRYPYMLSKVQEGALSYEKVVELCCENPAKLFGCDAKGFLIPGKDADFVIYNPNLKITAGSDTTHTACDHTIWDGYEYHGYIEQTYLRGKLIYDHGKYVGNCKDGRFVKRVPIS